MLVHDSLAAPLDTWTGQPMSLELSGTLCEVDGLNLDTPEGKELSEQRWHRVDREAPVPGSLFTVRLEAATYANLAFPGVGVPFYM